VIPTVLDFHHQLAAAIEKKSENNAIHVMTRLLAHGEKILKELITQ
jgi:DNA-binding FadR family transcriptional regulator